MSLNIIIGDNSTERSNKLCSMMVEKSLERPSGKIIAIVPEQATLLMQKRVINAHPRNATDNIEIVSFNFLARMVFAELGQNIKEVLDDTGKSLLLKKVLSEIKDELKVYKKKAHMPGFVNEVRSMVSELAQYGIDDNELFLMQQAAEEKGSRLLYAKLDDLRLMYRKYNEAVSEKFVTAEEIPDIFARLAAKSAIIRGAHIYMDGFTGFTPIQYRLLREFLICAEEVNLTIALPEDKLDEACPDHELFYLSNSTVNRMRQLAGEAKTECSILVCESNKENNPENALYHEAGSIEDEVTYVARKILHLVREEKLRFKDIAVIVSDMEAYHRPISRIFDEAGIPCFIDHKNDLSNNALSRYVINVVRLVDENFSFDSVFSVLKTGFTAITDEEINLLENYCLEFGIRGINRWKKDFAKSSRSSAGSDLDRINSIRKKVFEEFAGFYESLKNSDTAPQYKEALKMLFEHNGIEKRTLEMAEIFREKGMLSRGAEYDLVFDAVNDLIEKIGLILGTEKLSLDEYADILVQGLSDIKVSIAPPSIDTVVVGDLTRTRTAEVQALFLIGANEGKIPSAPGGSMIFTQKEREFLRAKDFEIAPTLFENIFIQRFYIYLAFTKPGKYLYITNARLLPDGNELLPSYIVTTPEDIVSGIRLEKDEDIPAETWKNLELMKLAMSMEEPDEELLNYFAKEDALRLKQIFSGAFFTNKESRLDKKISEGLYGEVLKGSVSRYEKFNECPFKHFLKYGLKIEKRPEYEVQAFDIGNIYHYSLEIYSKKIKDKGLSLRGVTDEESRAVIREALNEAVERVDNDAMLATARSTYMLRRIADVTEKTVDVLREHVRLGKYDPLEFEWHFETEPKDGLSFRGSIDRVDIYDGDDILVKIIDYKSGSKAFSITDIYSGTQLQLVAYLGEAIDMVKKDNPERNVVPGGVYYYLVNDKYIKEKDKAEKRHSMSGLTNCSDESFEAIDTTCNVSKPGTSVVTGIKFGTGGAGSAGSIANTEELNALIGFVHEKMDDTARNIKEGKVDISPVSKGQWANSCVYCDYRDVCKFEDGRFGVSFRQPETEATKEEIEDALFRGKKKTTDKKGEQEKK